jgi:hypothetical protein
MPAEIAPRHDEGRLPMKAFDCSPPPGRPLLSSLSSPLCIVHSPSHQRQFSEGLARILGAQPLTISFSFHTQGHQQTNGHEHLV